MTPIEFKNVLDAATPSADELQAYGLDPDEIEDVQRTFQLRERSATSGYSNTDDEDLIRLLRTYDCSTVELGLLRFREGFSKADRGWVFADCEADQVLLTDRGTIILQKADGGAESVCATDSSKFLDALAEFVLIRKEKEKWRGRVFEAARSCSNLAGGDECREFFEVLCGFLQ